MSTALDTREALGGVNLPKLQSRSLKLTRFACPSLKDDQRKQFFESALKMRPFDQPSPLKRWKTWLTQGLKLDDQSLLFAKLNSRLLLHMSGGTMENASILLDRFGYPYIPGSGIKGTVRHTILSAIRDWHSTGEAGSLEESHPFYGLTKGFQSPYQMLARALLLFGWSDGEWKEGRNRKGMLHSDCEYAFGDDWKKARFEVAKMLEKQNRVRLNNDGLPINNHVGCVRFLQAYPSPTEYPVVDDLELDVLTPHHTEYYAGKMQVALDVENPIPVYFPAVSSNINFLFAIICDEVDLRDFAMNGLDAALNTFGTGAKTNAGYGSFETQVTDQSEKARLKDERQELADEKRKITEAKKEAERIANLNPIDAARETLLKLKDKEFAEFVKDLPEKTQDEQQAVLQLMTTQKRDRWKKWKRRKPDIAKVLIEVATQHNFKLQ